MTVFLYLLAFLLGGLALGARDTLYETDCENLALKRQAGSSLSVRFDAQMHASRVQRLDQRIHDPECAWKARLTNRNIQRSALGRWQVAKIPMLRSPESPFGGG